MEKYGNQARMTCMVDEKFGMEEHWIVRARKTGNKLEIMQ